MEIQERKNGGRENHAEPAESGCDRLDPSTVGWFAATGDKAVIIWVVRQYLCRKTTRPGLRALIVCCELSLHALSVAYGIQRPVVIGRKSGAQTYIWWRFCT